METVPTTSSAVASTVLVGRIVIAGEVKSWFWIVPIMAIVARIGRCC